MRGLPHSALVVALTLGSVSGVHAAEGEDAEAEPTATTEVAPAPKPSRWAGSRINMLNTANAWQFDRGASLTWDPYYAIGFGLAPRFRIIDGLSIGASLNILGEMTESNVTTRDGEWWLDDLTLRLSSSGIALPVTGTRVSGGVAVSLPTSKPSQAATLVMGVRPSVSISHRFPVLSGLSLSYGGSLRVNVNRFTTPQRDAPTIRTCVTQCDELVHTGVRNVRWQHGHRLGLGLSVLDWLAIGGGFGIYASYLYDSATVVDAAAPIVEPAHARYAFSYDAELTVGPFAGVSAGLGLSTFAPQLAPDQTTYDPFFNRYTQAYLDLRVDVAALLTPEEG